MRLNKSLFTIHIFEFILFLGVGLFAFTLPQNKLEKFLPKGVDLFYKFLFGKGFSFVEDNYIYFGIGFTILGFIALICALIIHARSQKLIIINTIYSILMILFFPIGTILAFFTFPFLYTYGKDDDLMEDEELEMEE